MGLEAVFQESAVTLEKAFGDLFKAVDYQPAPDMVDYDPVNGRPIWHALAPLVATTMVRIDYRRQDRFFDSSLLATDRRGIIMKLSLPGVTPKVGDVLREGSGAVWRISLVDIDPATAAWDLRLQPFLAGWPADWV